MTGDNDNTEPALSPAEVIRRHCRGIKASLAAIDLTNPAAAVMTDRMRGQVDILLYDLNEVVGNFIRSRR